MIQPEIKFILKICRIRNAAERIHANKKPGVMAQVAWIERHLQANKYASTRTAQKFLIDASEKIEYIIPNKAALLKEFYILLYGYDYLTKLANND